MRTLVKSLDDRKRLCRKPSLRSSNMVRKVVRGQNGLGSLAMISMHSATILWYGLHK